jgi:hypothetical protein
MGFGVVLVKDVSNFSEEKLILVSDKEEYIHFWQ